MPTAIFTQSHPVARQVQKVKTMQSMLARQFMQNGQNVSKRQRKRTNGVGWGVHDWSRLLASVLSVGPVSSRHVSVGPQPQR